MLMLPWQLAWGMAIITEWVTDPWEHVIPRLFCSVHGVHHLAVLVSPTISSVVWILVGHWELVNAGLYARPLEVPVSFHKALCLLQRRSITAGWLLMVGRGCSRRTHTTSLARRHRIVVKNLLAMTVVPAVFSLQRSDLSAQIRQHREQPLDYLLVLVYIYCLRADGQLHILVRIPCLFVKLLHSLVEDLLRISDLPEFPLELLYLLRARFIELRLLFPRGWSLSTDVVEVVFAILGEFGMFELPTLCGRSVPSRPITTG